MTIVDWTNETGKELTLSIAQLQDWAIQLRDSVVTEDIRNIIQDNSIDGLKITAQALLQLAAQSQRDMEIMQQRQAESDERFNVLLEELRYLNRRNDRRENGESA